mmetsp:Transcript_17417/g.52234  ORF Transcript_17417/g.52234 Transcript_17417/m.52234 type:complete len:102 (+) Transcript_17417:2531-2836(+)
MPQVQPLVAHKNCQKLPSHVQDTGGFDFGTWDFRPVYRHLNNWDVQSLGQVDELHIKTPALETCVSKHPLSSAAGHELEATLCIPNGTTNYHRDQQMEAMH